VNRFQTEYSKVAEILHHWRPGRPRSSQMHSSHHMVDHSEKADEGGLTEIRFSNQHQTQQTDNDLQHGASFRTPCVLSVITWPRSQETKTDRPIFVQIWVDSPSTIGPGVKVRFRWVLREVIRKMEINNEGCEFVRCVSRSDD